MKRHAALLIALASLALPAMAEPVTFTLEGVEARGGTLYVGVQTEDQYQKNAGVDGDVIKAPEAGTMSFTFDLPVGEYAISVWHDFDDDNVFDMTENGMPADGWTATNARSLRAAPTFADVSFTVETGGTDLKEAMIYPFQ